MSLDAPSGFIILARKKEYGCLHIEIPVDVAPCLR
jgi:hypothetical protein